MISPASTDSATDIPSRKVSTPPSSPPSGSSADTMEKIDLQENKDEPHEVEMIEENDDDGLDDKGNALTHLLNQSSVFVAIMADKMKEQQRKAQDTAQRQEAKKRAADEKANAPKATARKSTRTQADVENIDTSKENADPEPDKVTHKMPSRGRPKKNAAKKNNILDHFKNEDVDIQGDAPTVQEALAAAAEDYEAKPEGLGVQQLVATQQPGLVTGGQMRHYQLEGLEWMKTLWMNGLGGILADEMGLGKTIQAISLIAFFKEQNIPGPFLIVAPLSTVNNWIDEFARWTPDIKTLMYHGSKTERAEKRNKHLKIRDQEKHDFPVVCTSYEICMNDRQYLSHYKWKYIIVDEGHRLKNMDCKLIKELMLYPSANRLLITGTPLQNNIAELWSLLHFLLPEVFNDLDSFQSWFDFSSVLDDKTEAGRKASKRKNDLVSTMHAILKPFLLRRVKTDVETSLPKKREYILYAPMTSEQRSLYQEIMYGDSRRYLEEKAVERIEARSRTTSLKRKANDSGYSTPAKSIKPSRDSTPASTSSTTTSIRRGRKAARSNYKDITDREFDTKLRRLENGEDDSISNDNGSINISSDEQEEITRAHNLKLAKKEIANKKLQNSIMQCRLVCNSPHNFYWPWTPTPSDPSPLVDETLVTASGKMLLLDRLLPRLFSLGHKVLIFSQFTSTLEIVHNYASDLRDWSCCRIDGSTSQAERSSQIKDFNTDPEFKLFLLSTRAGGQGINLVAADTVILFDSDWNPQQDLQAMDRAHRIGQKRPVIVYRFATRNTVEETLLLKADGKRKLEKLVIQKGKFKSLFDGVDAKKGKMKAEDMEELKGALAGDDFEKFDPATDGGEVLSEEDLKILTDRSEKAYERAEKGLDVGGDGAAFRVAETKKGVEVLGDLSHKGSA